MGNDVLMRGKIIIIFNDIYDIYIINILQSNLLIDKNND